MQPCIMALDTRFYRSHTTFATVSDMVQLTLPLKKIGLTYFTHDRTYLDGAHLRLTNAPEWIEHYYKSEIYKRAIFEKDSKWLDEGFIFWSFLKREPIYDAAASFDIDHGLTIVEKHDHYSDFFHFGSARNKAIAQDLLLANIGMLYDYINYYKHQGQKLITVAEKTRFILPGMNETNELPTERLNEIEELDLKNILRNQPDRYYFGPSYLTKREMDIIFLLRIGSNESEIARQLNLSVRTLETHIKNIKEKTGCRTLFELGYFLANKNFSVYQP